VVLKTSGSYDPRAGLNRDGSYPAWRKKSTRGLGSPRMSKKLLANHRVTDVPCTALDKVVIDIDYLSDNDPNRLGPGAHRCSQVREHPEHKQAEREHSYRKI
jgi:hypothetical protein